MSNLGAMRRWVVNANPWPHYPQGTALVPIVEGAGWASGLICTGTENGKPLALTEGFDPGLSSL